MSSDHLRYIFKSDHAKVGLQSQVQIKEEFHKVYERQDGLLQLHWQQKED